MSRHIWLLSLVCVVEQVQCVDEISSCETQNHPAPMSMLQLSADVSELRNDNSSLKLPRKELLPPVAGSLISLGQTDGRMYTSFAVSLQRGVNIRRSRFEGFQHYFTDNHVDAIALVAGLLVAGLELLMFICFGISNFANLVFPGNNEQNLGAKGKPDANATPGGNHPWLEAPEFSRSQEEPAEARTKGTEDSLAVRDENDPTRLKLLPFLCISLGAHAMCCTDSYVPNLPEMASDLRARDNWMALTLPLNWMVKGIAALLIGAYSDVVGRKPVMMICCLMIVFSSIACAAAGSYYTFLAARVLQGIGEGGDAVVQAIIRDKYPDLAKRQSIMTAVQATMMLSPMLAAPGFGLLGTYVGWRTVFMIMALWGLANLALCACILQHEPSRQRIPLIIYLTTVKNILTTKPLVALLSVLTLTWCSQQTALTFLAFVLEVDMGVSAQGTVLALALIPLFVPPGIIIANRGSQLTSPTFTLKALMVAQFVSVQVFFLFGLLFTTHVWGVVAPYCIGTTLNMAALATAHTIFMQPLKDFAGVAGGILSCCRELLGGIASLVGSQIAIRTLGDGLLYFNGGMLTLMLALFWSWFGISPPNWAHTEEEKNES